MNGFSTNPVPGGMTPSDGHGPLGVPRHEQHLERRLAGPQPLDQLAPAHLGHDHIGQDQIDRPLASSTMPERVGAVARLDAPYTRGARAAAAPSSAPRPRPPPAASSRSRPAGSGGPPGVRGERRPVMARQEDGESGALARRALDRDVPAALLHDAVDRGQAEAGALAGLLGGEEGLEDPRLRRHVHADAGVAHGEHDVGAGPHAVAARVVGGGQRAGWPW